MYHTHSGAPAILSSGCGRSRALRCRLHISTEECAACARGAAWEGRRLRPWRCHRKGKGGLWARWGGRPGHQRLPVRLPATSPVPERQPVRALLLHWCFSPSPAPSLPSSRHLPSSVSKNQSIKSIFLKRKKGPTSSAPPQTVSISFQPDITEPSRVRDPRSRAWARGADTPPARRSPWGFHTVPSSQSTPKRPQKPALLAPRLLGKGSRPVPGPCCSRHVTARRAGTGLRHGRSTSA